MATKRESSRNLTKNGAATPADETAEYEPKTELWRRLWEIRARNIASGQPMLDWDGIEREVAERRGGIVVSTEEAYVR